VLSDEISRRDGRAAAVRADRGHLDPEMQLERWDETAKVTYDRTLWNELVSLRFLDAMDPTESRDAYEILTVVRNRGPMVVRANSIVPPFGC
jgi:hypothetical protein